MVYILYICTLYRVYLVHRTADILCAVEHTCANLWTGTHSGWINSAKTRCTLTIIQHSFVSQWQYSYRIIELWRFVESLRYTCALQVTSVSTYFIPSGPIDRCITSVLASMLSTIFHCSSCRIIMIIRIGILNIIVASISLTSYKSLSLTYQTLTILNRSNYLLRTIDKNIQVLGDHLHI